VEVWRQAAALLARLTARLGKARIAAVGLSGAMHTLTPIGPGNIPLARATTWQDACAAELVKPLSEQIDADQLYRETGCPLLPVYHPPRLRWMRLHQPELFGRAERFVGIKDYVLFQLTGQWATDITSAAATGLLDIHRLMWHEPALELSTMTAERLPVLALPRAVIGRVNSQASQLTGLPVDTPVVAGVPDGAAANIAVGAGGIGRTAISTSTSAAVRRCVAQPHFDARMRSWCYVLDIDRWLAGCALNNAGSAVNQLRRQFYPHLRERKGFQQLFIDAEQAPPGAEGLVALPFFIPERGVPWDHRLPNVMDGLITRHSPAHHIRATLEGIAHSIAAACRTAAGTVGGESLDEPIHATGGLMRFPLWRRILADVLGRPIVALEGVDASAMGAAMVARAGVDRDFSPYQAMAAYQEIVTYPRDDYRPIYEAAHARFLALIEQHTPASV